MFWVVQIGSAFLGVVCAIGAVATALTGHWGFD